MRFHSLVFSIAELKAAAIGTKDRRMYGRRVVGHEQNAYEIGSLFRCAGKNRRRRERDPKEGRRPVSCGPFEVKAV